MKENMQKTPLVQEKSNRYHRLEEEKADNLLNSIINETDNVGKDNVNIQESEEKKL
jgi:hypothetical protein